MLRTTLAGLRAHAVRLVLSAVAIVLGVGFLAGTRVYGDTATAAFYSELARGARHVDTWVGPSGVPTFTQTSRRVDAGALNRIRALPGVARADGRVAERLPMLGRDGRVVANVGSVGWAVSVPAYPSLAQYDLVAGRSPARPGEVAVDRSTVDSQGFAPGGMVTVLDPDRKPVRLTVVGVLDLGTNRRFEGGTVAALTDADLHRLVHPAGYAEIVATAAPGVSQRALAAAVRQAVGARYDVETGDAYRYRLAVAAGKYVDGLLATMLAFGVVALGVCAFVVHNTFAILVAQRVRELALLRCAGASRRQVFGSVLGEAALTGAAGGLGGLAASLGLGWVLLVARTRVGGGVAAHGLVVAPRTVLLALAAGVGLTVLAACGPAVTASRVRPVVALGAAVGPDRPRRVVARLAAAGVLGLAGVLVAAAGVPRAFAGTPLVFTGAVVVFAALVVASPVVVPPLVGLLGALPGRRSTVVRLATANARRSPRRVAATTCALAVGLALMSLVSVLLATAKVQTRRELDENFPLDYVVTGSYTGRDSTVPVALAADLRATPGIAAAAACRVSDARVGGRRTTVWTAEPGALTGVLRPEVMTGTLSDRHPGAVALNRFFAADLHVGLGAPVRVVSRTFTVTALYDDSPVDAPVLLDWADYTTLFGAGPADRVLVRARDGVPPARSRRAVESALAPYPLAQLGSAVEVRTRLAASVDRQLAILGALLAVSVVIGLAGVANTLALSVVERRGESALLRALGLTARALRATLLVEAVLVAVAGGLVGIGLGALTGVVAAQALIRAYGHGSPVVPVGQLGAYLALAGAAGALAAVLPARRLGRLPVVSHLG